MDKIACPRCGVAVTPGYVKCPKCHGRLPSMPVAGRTRPGGTVAPSAQADRTAWIYGGIGVLVVGGALAFTLAGSKSTPPRATEAFVVVDAPSAAVAVPTGVPVPERTGPAERRDPQGAALTLERELQRARIWSTVKVREDELRIESQSCAEPGMATAIAEAAASLKAQGLVSVRCAEPHGAIAFDRPL